MEELTIIHVTLIYMTSFTAAVTFHDNWPEGKVSPVPGHYPYIFCSITDAVFNSSEATFVYQSKSPHHNQCKDIIDIWSIKNNQWLHHVDCDRTYDVGMVFTIYYFYGSNYFHLHVDMLIPLFSLFYHQKDNSHTKAVFMPTVETRRLQKVNWDTPAFDDMTKFWVETVKVITGKHTLIPLQRNILGKGKNICFKKLHLGTPEVDFTDRKLIREFIHFVKNHFQANEEKNSRIPGRLAIDRRLGRRQITNLDELVRAVSPFIKVDLLNFSSMTLKEQVTTMGKYTIFAALNGAGLMNALYLPSYAVSIQLVPYQSPLNFVEYGDLLKTRGPYLEWHNKHKEKNFYMDKGNRDPLTEVHVKEFVELIKEAIKLTRSTRPKGKEEL